MNRPVGNSTTIERESRETRPFYVVDLDLDGELVDVTANTVEVSFARRNARPLSWSTAAWAAGGPFDTPLGAAWAAEAEIGGVGSGADIEIPAGEWLAYVRVTTATERPVIPAGVLVVD